MCTFWIHHSCRVILFLSHAARSVLSKRFWLIKPASFHSKSYRKIQRRAPGEDGKYRITDRIKYNPLCVIYPCISSGWHGLFLQMKGNMRRKSRFFSPWPLLWQRFRSAPLYNPCLGNDRFEGSSGDNLLSGGYNDEIPLLPMGRSEDDINWIELLCILCLRGTVSSSCYRPMCKTIFSISRVCIESQIHQGEWNATLELS